MLFLFMRVKQEMHKLMQFISITYKNLTNRAFLLKLFTPCLSASMLNSGFITVKLLMISLALVLSSLVVRVHPSAC